MMLFKEHHKWKDIIWFVGSLATFTSNLEYRKGAWWALLAKSGHRKFGC